MAKSSLDGFYTHKKLKSLEATSLMKSKFSELLEEDKRMVETEEKYTLKDITLFCSGDFDIENGRHGRIIKDGKRLLIFKLVREWFPISDESEKRPDKENIQSSPFKMNENYNQIKESEVESKIFNSEKKYMINRPKFNLAEETINLNTGSQNLILRNKIIKLSRPMNNFGSRFGLKIEMEFLMAGESSLYIFSRGDCITSKVAVSYIEKELDSNRKFLSFGVIENKNGNNILKTHKKQEIPKTGIKYTNLLK